MRLLPELEIFLFAFIYALVGGVHLLLIWIWVSIVLL